MGVNMKFTFKAFSHRRSKPEGTELEFRFNKSGWEIGAEMTPVPDLRRCDKFGRIEEEREGYPNLLAHVLTAMGIYHYPSNINNIISNIWENIEAGNYDEVEADEKFKLLGEILNDIWDRLESLSN